MTMTDLFQDVSNWERQYDPDRDDVRVVWYNIETHESLRVVEQSGPFDRVRYALEYRSADDDWTLLFDAEHMTDVEARARGLAQDHNDDPIQS